MGRVAVEGGQRAKRGQVRQPHQRGGIVRRRWEVRGDRPDTRHKCLTDCRMGIDQRATSCEAKTEGDLGHGDGKGKEK